MSGSGSGNSTVCLIQLTNPDISGIGVRISFYIQIFLTTGNAIWTFIGSSFGLMIAAVVQTSEGELSLYQAIEVANLLGMTESMLNLFVTVLIRILPVVYRFAWLVYEVQYYMYFVLVYYMWSHADTFGPSSDCNSSMKFVVFFANMRALGPGKIVSLVLGSIELFFSVLLTIFGLIIFVKSWRTNADVEEDEDKDVYYPMSFENKLGLFIPLIFFVSWNELYIHRNNTDRSDAQWGFGQPRDIFSCNNNTLYYIRPTGNRKAQEKSFGI